MYKLSTTTILPCILFIFWILCVKQEIKHIESTFLPSDWQINQAAAADLPHIVLFCFSYNVTFKPWNFLVCTVHFSAPFHLHSPSSPDPWGSRQWQSSLTVPRFQFLFRGQSIFHSWRRFHLLLKQPGPCAHSLLSVALISCGHFTAEAKSSLKWSCTFIIACIIALSCSPVDQTVQAISLSGISIKQVLGLFISFN